MAVTAAAERVLNAISEQRPVGEIGDRVVERLVRELCFELLALGDVAKVDDDATDEGVLEQVGHHALRVQQSPVAVANGEVESL